MNIHDYAFHYIPLYLNRSTGYEVLHYRSDLIYSVHNTNAITRVPMMLLIISHVLRIRTTVVTTVKVCCSLYE